MLYFSDHTVDYPALRLRNADSLGAGLTIASENPVYTVGNFNSVDKKPAAILADAITFLSNKWESSNYDTKSTRTSPSAPRNATTVNCSYLTGNIETTSSNYNGGFENLPRFLESGLASDFNWSGSAVNLWNSTPGYRHLERRLLRSAQP